MVPPIELDAEFQKQRGFQLYELAKRDLEEYRRWKQEQQQSGATPTEDATPRWRRRLGEGTGMLMRGMLGGTSVGFVAGTFYGIVSQSPTPLGIGIRAGVSVGLVSAQYMGFRYMLPDGLHRLYYHHILSNDEERLEAEYFDDPASKHFSALPQWWTEDLTDRDRSVLASAAAGAASGYLMTRVQAHSLAKLQKLSTAHAHTVGMRGGLIYGLVFGLGQWGYYRVMDWRQRRVVDQQLRDLYNRQEPVYSAVGTEAMMKTEDLLEPGQPLPDRRKVVQSSWSEILSNPLRYAFYERGWTIPDWMPLIHSEEQFQRRQELEQTCGLLKEQVDIMEKLDRTRKREIRMLEAKVAELKAQRAEQQQQRQRAAQEAEASPVNESQCQ